MPNEKFGLSNVEKGTTEPDKQGVIWIDDTSGDVKLQYNAGGGTPAYKTLGGGAGTNALLDGTNHTDTTAGTVARGDIITGQGASPTWKRLAAGTQSQVLRMGANEPEWGTSPAGAFDHTSGYYGNRTVFANRKYTRLTSGSIAYIDNVYYNTAALGINSASTASVDKKNGGAFYSATATNSGGISSGFAGFSPDMYPYMRVRMAVTDNVDGTVWVGFGSGNFTEAADPGIMYAAFRCRNGTDTTWQAITSDNSSGPESTDTLVSLSSDFVTFEVWTDDAGVTWQFAINGDIKASHSSVVPTATTSHSVFAAHYAITSSTREGWLKSVIVAAHDPASTDSGSTYSDVNSGFAGL